jgi:hypothetical protein
MGEGQMKKKHIAGCLAVSLVGAEFCESKDHRSEHALSLEPGSTNTLVGNPHTHFEPYTEFRATTTAPLSVSGGQGAEESFRLFIYPANSGSKLIGHPVSADLNGTPAQSMYGFCPSVESLTDVLSKAELPPLQIDAIRRSAIAGNVQEIGGSRSPVIRLFSRGQLEEIGMSFRPVD